MVQKTLLKGALLLLAANILNKILGFGYRIILVRVLGTEGIGLTEMIMPIYSFCLVVASWGLPVAMSRQIAAAQGRGQTAEIEQTCRVGLTYLALGGIITSLVIYRFAPFIVEHFVADDRTLWCLRTLTPAIFMVALCSGLRAYFQGLQQIGTIGVAQNIEQLLRVICGIILAYHFLPYGLEVAILSVSIASVAGEAGGLLFMLWRYKHRKRSATGEKYLGGRLLPSLLSYGTPVTLQRLAATFLMMLQAMLIPRLLQQAGFSASQSVALYGSFFGVALSLLHLPGIFTYTLGVAMLPAVAAELSPRALHHKINTSLHITSVVSLPVTLLFICYGQELCTWIFNAPEAAESLSILAWGVLFIYAQSALGSVLQGTGQVAKLLINLLGAAVVLLASLFLLVPQPWGGIRGVALATLMFNLSYTLLNLYCLYHYCGVHYQWTKILLKPILAAATAFGGLQLASPVINNTIASPYGQVIAGCIIGGLIYILLLFALGAFPSIKMEKKQLL